MRWHGGLVTHDRMSFNCVIARNMYIEMACISMSASYQAFIIHHASSARQSEFISFFESSTDLYSKSNSTNISIDSL